MRPGRRVFFPAFRAVSVTDRIFFFAAGRRSRGAPESMAALGGKRLLKLWKVGGSGKSGRHAGPERKGVGRMVGA